MRALQGVSTSDHGVTVRWTDGQASLFPHLWLRDNCACPRCRHASGQRLFDILDLPEEVQAADVAVEEGGIRVRWRPEGHDSRYRGDWLAAHDLGAEERNSRHAAPKLWGQEIGNDLPQASWPALCADPGEELRLLDGFADRGFALLRDVPIEKGAVLEVGNRLGFVRVTNYGDLFDVISVPDPNNLAYTALGLSVHTDNPYRDPTPGVQLLHCLESEAPGGDSILVDGFRAAARMREEDPEGFELLTRLPLSFRFADAGADLRARTPIISLDADGAVSAVHLNNRSAGTVDGEPEEVTRWYQAYRRFVRLLRSPEAELRLRLDPGDLLVMQNNRALHGRTAFDPSLGRRHLQGCYVDLDGVWSRRRVLARQRGEERP